MGGTRNEWDQPYEKIMARSDDNDKRMNEKTATPEEEVITSASDELKAC